MCVITPLLNQENSSIFSEKIEVSEIVTRIHINFIKYSKAVNNFYYEGCIFLANFYKDFNVVDQKIFSFLKENNVFELIAVFAPIKERSNIKDSFFDKGAINDQFFEEKNLDQAAEFSEIESIRQLKEIFSSSVKKEDIFSSTTNKKTDESDIAFSFFQKLVSPFALLIEQEYMKKRIEELNQAFQSMKSKVERLEDLFNEEETLLNSYLEIKKSSFS